MPAKSRARRIQLHLERLEDRLVPSGAPYTEAPVIESDPVTHVLTATLTEQIGPAQVGDVSVVDAWTYNGVFAGPTLHAQPGDLLDLTIVNQLPEDTNLHTHGLHVSPLGNSDDVLLDIEPNHSNHYQIQIPQDHPEGLYWYHPHMHGNVNNQITRGLSGLLIIGHADGGAPQLANFPQFHMGFKNVELQGNHIVNPQQVEGANFNPANQIYLVNGQLDPVLTLVAGQTVVFNMANIGNNGFFSLSLVDQNGTAVNGQLVAEDGNPFSHGAQPGPAPVLPPGRRWSFAFTPPTNAVNGWKLLFNTVSDGTHTWPGPNPVTVLTINFQGSQQAGGPIGPLTPPNNFFTDLRQLPVSESRTVVFGEMMDPTTGQMVDTINGAQFPNNIVFQPRLNTVEEWTLVNNTADDHPFHLHIDPQQVTVAGGPGGNLGGLARYTDVINVPHGSSVVIRIRFFDFLGSFVYHCHRVDHEDNGMMSLVQVLPQQSILVTGACAGGGPQVNVFNGDSGNLLNQFFAFDQNFTGGVNVAVGDVNHDGVSDVLCAAGAGGGPSVRVLSGKDFSTLYNFFAFDSGFTGGVNIAAGDINGDGFDDIICGAGAGGGPQVRIFSGKDGALLQQYFAYDQGFTGGVSVASGDLDGNGRFEVITGAGAGGGPQVRVFDFQGQQVAAFFALDPAFTGGVNVSTGRVRGIGFDSLICGAGAGGGPTVNTFQTTSIHEGGMSDAMNFQLISSISAFAQNFTGGVRVASFNETLGTDYLAGAGAGGGPNVVLLDGVTHETLENFFAYSQQFTGGVNVAAN